MEKSGAEPLVKLLTDPKPQIQANAAVCLTNLAHNGEEIRNEGTGTQVPSQRILSN